MVLLITRGEGAANRATLKLEGRLVAAWAALFEHECTALLRSSGAVDIDLLGVTFIDRAGIEALQRLSRAGVVIRRCSGLVASVLEGEGIPVRVN